MSGRVESNGGGDERPDWALDHHCDHLSEHEVGTVGQRCDVHWGQGCEDDVLGPNGERGVVGRTRCGQREGG